MVHLAEVVATVTLVCALAACTPDLRERSCDGPADCTPDERCIDHSCIPLSAFGDAQVDVSIEDAAFSDADQDTLGGDMDTSQDVSSDMGDDVDITGDLIAEDQGDATSEDLGDAASDTEVDDTDTEVDDTDAADAGSELNGVCFDLGTPAMRNVLFYQPLGAESFDKISFESPLDPAYVTDGGGPAPLSRWERRSEPIELPLTNGVRNADLLAYWSFDNESQNLSSDHPSGDDSSVLLRLLMQARPVAVDEGLGDRAAISLVVEDVLYGTVAGLGGASTFSVALAFRMPGVPDQGTILELPGGPDTRPELRIEVTELSSLQITLATTEGGGSGTPTVFVTGPILVPDVWYHVAVVRDRSLITVYLDGQALSSHHWLSLSDDDTVHGLMGSSNTVLLGGRLDGSGPDDFFVGYLDEVLIWSRALTPLEVRTLNTGAVYGGSFVAGAGAEADAQLDYDDVSYWEADFGTGDPVAPPQELAGARPHSDSPSQLDNVLGLWRFDEDANQLRGDAHPAFDTSTAEPTWAAGRFQASSALLIDSDSPPVALQGVYDPDAITVEAWVRILPALTTKLFLLSHGTVPTDAGLRLTLEPGEDDIELAFECGSDRASASLPASIFRNQWRHVAVTVDGGPNGLTLYVDGLPVGKDDSFSSCSMTEVADDLQIGFSGQTEPVAALDELIIHDTAVPAYELFNRTHPSLPVIRALINTDTSPDEDGRYRYATGALLWGNGDAQRDEALLGTSGFSCDSLLSPCADYVAWYRFDAPCDYCAAPEGLEPGVMVPDWSANQHHAWIEMGAVQITAANWTGSEQGLAPVALPAATVTLESEELELSIEGLLRPDDLAGNTLVANSTGGYALEHTNDGALSISFGDGAVTLDATCVRASCIIAGSWGSFGYVMLDGANDTIRIIINSVNSNEFSEQDVIESGLYGEFQIGHPETGSVDSVRFMSASLEEADFLHYPTPARVMASPTQCDPDRIGAGLSEPD